MIKNHSNKNTRPTFYLLLTSRYSSGFTLVEILFVLAIIVILLTLVVSGFASFKKSEALDLDKQMVVETLEQAKDQTLASYSASQYGVHFTSSSTTLFTGSSYSAGATGNVVYPLSSTDDTMSVSLVGGGADVIFNRLVGDTADSGSVVLTSSATHSTRTVTIYKTGLVSSN
jgi:prepilin-type N-terminal cleavage/methylation domain-containing protein